MHYHGQGPVTGSSSHQTGRSVLLSVVLTLVLFALIRGLGSGAITFGLIVFFVALVAAGLQAVKNGSLVASWLLVLSFPFGVVWALSPGWPVPEPRAGALEFRSLLLFGLFFGTLMYVIGIESARYFDEEPRDRGVIERIGTVGLLVLLAVFFAISGMAVLFTPSF